MTRAFIALALVLLSACATPVSLSDLFDKQATTARIIRVEGYVSLDFEGTQIYANRASCEASEGDRLWLDVSPNYRPANWEKCALYEVTGAYSPEETGHFGMSPDGGLVSISQIRRLRASSPRALTDRAP